MARGQIAKSADKEEKPLKQQRGRTLPVRYTRGKMPILYY